MKTNIKTLAAAAFLLSSTTANAGIITETWTVEITGGFTGSKSIGDTVSIQVTYDNTGTQVTQYLDGANGIGEFGGGDDTIYYTFNTSNTALNADMYSDANFDFSDSLFTELFSLGTARDTNASSYKGASSSTYSGLENDGISYLLDAFSVYLTDYDSGSGDTGLVRYSYFGLSGAALTAETNFGNITRAVPGSGSVPSPAPVALILLGLTWLLVVGRGAAVSAFLRRLLGESGSQGSTTIIT